MVTVDNVAVVLQNRALDAPKLGMEVEATALEDIQLVFSSVIHYSLRMTAPWRITSFFLFFYAESFVPTERKKCVNTYYYVQNDFYIFFTTRPGPVVKIL